MRIVLVLKYTIYSIVIREIRAPHFTLVFAVHGSRVHRTRNGVSDIKKKPKSRHQASQTAFHATITLRVRRR